MKHRKFVKQLQALGLDRNGAEMCAAHSRRIREPYADGLARFQRCLRAAEEIIQSCPCKVNFTAQDVAVVKVEQATAEETLHRLLREAVTV